MVFVCVCIRTPNGTAHRFLKPWYGRTVQDANRSLIDLFNEYACGEFDSKDAIDDKKRENHCFNDENILFCFCFQSE